MAHEQVNVRLSFADRQLLNALVKRLGLNQTSVVRLALRVLADKEKVER